MSVNMFKRMTWRQVAAYWKRREKSQEDTLKKQKAGKYLGRTAKELVQTFTLERKIHNRNVMQKTPSKRSEANVIGSCSEDIPRSKQA